MRCIQNNGVIKNDRNLDNAVLSLRLKSAEAARFWKLMDSAKARNPYADRSDVIRELLGLLKPIVLTESEIEYFRTGKKANLQPKTKMPSGEQVKVISPKTRTKKENAA